MKYRVLERTESSGSTCFYPQQRKLFLWINFWELEFFPKPIKFFSLEEAKAFITKQIKKPKDKIHYV